MKSDSIILLGDEGKVEELRKSLLASVRDPRIKRFEELRDQGFDSETARDLSGLDTLSQDAQSEVILGTASRGVSPRSPAYELVQASTYEIPQALRNVGAAAGSAVGSVIGMNMLRAAASNATTVGIVAGTGVVIAGSMMAAKYITRAHGAWWATVAVMNIMTAVGIVGRAWIKNRGVR